MSVARCSLEPPFIGFISPLPGAKAVGVRQPVELPENTTSVEGRSRGEDTERERVVARERLSGTSRIRHRCQRRFTASITSPFVKQKSTATKNPYEYK